MKEKEAPVWPKIVAVIFSIALGAGYVGWRKHQADKAAQQAAEAKADEAVESLTLMVGSKSPGRDVIIELEDLSNEQNAEISRLLMSSSKSMVMPELIELEDVNLGDFGVPIEPDVDSPEGEPSDSPRTLMPSSKSISGIFTTQRKPDEESAPAETEEAAKP